MDAVSISPSLKEGIRLLNHGAGVDALGNVTPQVISLPMATDEEGLRSVRRLASEVTREGNSVNFTYVNSTHVMTEILSGFTEGVFSLRVQALDSEKAKREAVQLFPSPPSRFV